MKMTYNNAYALKSYFINYISNVLGRDKSVGHYLTSLNTVSKLLKERGLVKEDIFEIKDLKYLSYVNNYVLNDPVFIHKDTIGHHMYSVGLKHYYKFASGEDFSLLSGQEKLLDIPIDPEKPEIIEQTVWRRSNIIRSQALKIANYSCEIDNSHISFIADSSKKPYMEGHHAIPMKLQGLFDNSLDVYANIVCLCPVCHKRIHFGLIEDRKEMLGVIYRDRSDRLANSGIRLSDEEFFDVVLSQE